MSTEKILGIDSNFIRDAFYGLIIGLVIVFLGNVFGVIGAIGIPLNLTVTLDEIGKFLVIVIVASIVETMFFFQFILSFFDDKVEKNFNIKISFFVAALLTASTFALFHLSVYGFQAGGSFISAALMGIIFSYQVKLTKSALPAIITHAVINFSILATLTPIFG